MSERRTFSVSVFARHEGRVLLIRHRRLGVWLPVGGEVEAGETPLEAAARELFEETGLTGSFPSLPDIDGAPPGIIGYEEHAAGEKGLHLTFAFVADVDHDQVRPNDEFDAWSWVADPASTPCPLNVAQLARRALDAGRMTMTREGLEDLARVWLARFNSRDLDGLLALYAEDAVHVSPKLRAREPHTNGEIRGKDNLRIWWDDAMRRLPGLHYALRHLTADGDRVFMEYERQNPGEPSFMVAEVLVARGGRIIASTVYHG